MFTIHFPKDIKNKVYCNNTDLLPTGIGARQIMLFLTNEAIKNQNNNIIFESKTSLFKKIKENRNRPLCGKAYRKAREDLLKMSNVHVEVKRVGSEKVLYDGKIVNNFCLRGPGTGGEICLDKKFFNFLLKNYITIESNEYVSLPKFIGERHLFDFKNQVSPQMNEKIILCLGEN